MTITQENSNQDGIRTVHLAEIPTNCSAQVVGIEAGRRATQRLSGLGITPGTVIKRLSSAPFHGPIQVAVRGTRLALGRGLAAKILVKTNFPCKS